MNKESTQSCAEPRQINVASTRILDHSTQIFQHHIPTQLVLLGVVEFAMFVLAFYAGIELRFYNVDMTREALVGQILPKALLFALAMSVGMISMSTYQRGASQQFGPMLIRVAGAMMLGIVPLTLSYYFAPQFFLGRGALALAVCMSFVGTVVIRVFFSRVISTPALKPRILVLGTGKSANLVRKAQDDGEVNGLNIVGFCAMNSNSKVVGANRIIELDRSLLDTVAEKMVDQIVVAVDDRRNGLPVQDILDCKMSGVEVVDLLTFFERETGKVRLDILQPSWLFLSDGFRQSVVRRSAKRLFDIGAALAILPFAAPFMLIAAVCVFVESGFKGPVLYRQVRVGQNGAQFEIVKFRSMRTDAESDGVARWAQNNDSRITRVGALMRKTRLDELPQLFNVLRGEMSFVGPRPERPEFTRELARSIPYYNERHRVKPGLTGWAQIRYAYGASTEDAVEKLQYDLYYVKNYSIFMDLVVLLQTAEVVLLGKGAQ